MRIIITFICANAGVILTIQSEQGVLMKSNSPVLVVPDWGVLTESEWGVLEKSDCPVLITPEYSQHVRGRRFEPGILHQTSPI